MLTRRTTAKPGFTVLVIVMLAAAATSRAESPLEIGPVAGLTTAWHRAPAESWVPLGSVALFRQRAAAGWTVEWTGAVETGAIDPRSVENGGLDEIVYEAVAAFARPGTHEVTATLRDPSGLGVHKSRFVATVVDVPVGSIRVGEPRVSVDPVKIEETLPTEDLNAVTMRYYFGESIALLRDLGEGRYRTSVRRSVAASVDVDPSGFAPLIEWRVDGEAAGLGASATHAMATPGVHEIEAGPSMRAARFELETYQTTIRPLTMGESEEIPEDRPVLFVAQTEPAGYEDEVTWLTSTKYGRAAPVMGRGGVFAARFEDTWGPDGFQWLGVKADNAAFGQDQKGDIFGTGYELADAATIVTDMGNQIATVFGRFLWEVRPANPQGVRAIVLREFGLASMSVPATDRMGRQSETGEISFLFQEPAGVGTWDTRTGQLEMALEFEVGYDLVDAFVPPQPADPSDSFDSAKESWIANIMGFAQLSEDGSSLILDADFQAQVTKSLTNRVFEMHFRLPQDCPRKEFNLPDCPEECRTNKKKLCIQPVFVCKDDGSDCTGRALDKFKMKATAVWSKCCIELEFKEPKKIHETDFQVIEGLSNEWESAGVQEIQEMFKKKGPDGESVADAMCIEVYFVQKLKEADGDEHAEGDGVTFGRGEAKAKVVVADQAIDCDPPMDQVLGHELGHAMGLKEHERGTVMEGSDATPPNCDGDGYPNTATKLQCRKVQRKAPLLKEKNPKEECCIEGE